VVGVSSVGAVDVHGGASRAVGAHGTDVALHTICGGLVGGGKRAVETCKVDKQQSHYTGNISNQDQI